MKLPETLQHYYTDLANAGVLDENLPGVMTAFVQSLTEGKAILLQLQLDPARSRIEKACFKVHGCPYTIAVTVFICKQLQYQPIAMLEKINSAWIKQQLNLPKEQIYCALMGEEVVKKLLMLINGQ